LANLLSSISRKYLLGAVRFVEFIKLNRNNSNSSIHSYGYTHDYSYIDIKIVIAITIAFVPYVI